MISLHACPRCKGAVFEYSPAEDENALCINCGWRRAEVPQAILAQVEAHLGSPFVEHTPVRIGTGKPSPSGWERIRRNRELKSRRVL